MSKIFKKQYKNDTPENREYLEYCKRIINAMCNFTVHYEHILTIDERNDIVKFYSEQNFLNNSLEDNVDTFYTEIFEPMIKRLCQRTELDARTVLADIMRDMYEAKKSQRYMFRKDVAKICRK